MAFVQSETELSTAATDAVLGLVCLGLAAALVTVPTAAIWKRNVWAAVLILTACGSFLGAVAHGLDLSDAIRTVLWKPLYLALGVAVALVFVAAVYDGWGEPAARRLLPWAIVAGVIFSAVSQFLGGAFALFIAYEGVATLTALGIYALLATRGSLPGAAAIALGILISLAAAIVQVSSLSLRLGVRLDHNGLFHLIQTVGIVVMAFGVRASLEAA